MIRFGRWKLETDPWKCPAKWVRLHGPETWHFSVDLIGYRVAP